MRWWGKACGGCWPGALQAEVDAYIAQFTAERDENGRRLVVRNGYHQPRKVLTAAGAIEVTVPRVNDRRTDPDTGKRKRFPRRPCRRGCGRPRGSPRCCRCCICTGCHSGTSCPPWASSWAPQRGCRRGNHPADRDPGWLSSVRGTRPVLGGLRLPVGGRDPCEHPAGRAQPVPAGDDRRVR